MPRIKSMAIIGDIFNYKGREISVFLTFGMGSLGKNEIGNKFYYLIYYVIIVHLFLKLTNYLSKFDSIYLRVY